MPVAVGADISFGLRMQMREHILAWISRDVGLREFLIPDLLTDTWTQEQRQAWTTHIIDKYLHANSVGGRSTRRRILACETAGSLRRHCVRLRQRTASFRDIMKTSVSLESLWNDVSPELDDATWAKCSRWFDVALSSLRVSYVWMYLKSEASGPDATDEARKGLFEKLVDTYFVPEAPTDDKVDKHTANFKDLLQAWRSDLQVMMKSEKFDTELKRLEEVNNLSETAECIERFLGGVDVDKSWILKMQKLDKDLGKGKLVPRTGANRQASQAQKERKPRRTASPPKEGGKTRSGNAKRPAVPVQSEDVIDTDMLAESVSSFEPAPDSDFEVNAADEVAAEADEDSDSNEAAQEPLSAPVRVSPRHLVSPGARTLRHTRKREELELAKDRALREGTARPAKKQAVEVTRTKKSVFDSPPVVAEEEDDAFDEDIADTVKPEAVPESRESRRQRLNAALKADDSQSQPESRESRRKRLNAALEADESQSQATPLRRSSRHAK